MGGEAPLSLCSQTETITLPGLQHSSGKHQLQRPGPFGLDWRTETQQNHREHHRDGSAPGDSPDPWELTVAGLLEASADMKVFNLLYLLLLLAAVLAPASSSRPDFLNIRRKYHKHHCPHRRCLPLHSRVPFP